MKTLFDEIHYRCKTCYDYPSNTLIKMAIYQFLVCFQSAFMTLKYCTSKVTQNFELKGAELLNIVVQILQMILQTMSGGKCSVLLNIINYTFYLKEHFIIDDFTRRTYNLFMTMFILNLMYGNVSMDICCVNVDT